MRNKYMKKSDFEYFEGDKYDLPCFGFKIHISSTIDNYEYIFSLVKTYLCKYGIIFKYLKSKEIIKQNFSETESPTESGKFITIYPKNTEHCKDILEDLYRLIPNTAEGIYILSDRNYKDSDVIFYRYGCIVLDEDNLENGLPTLYGENGEKWQDYQRNYFDLPAWIDDIQEKQQIKSSYMSETYKVEALLKHSNGGNTYLASNKKLKKKVVIKESREHILCHNRVTKEKLRDMEWELIQGTILPTPKGVEKIKEWVNQYYIYDYISGMSLRSFCDENSLFSYSVRTPQQNYRKFNKLLNCFYKVLKIVSQFHDKDIILNDIHPDNFIIDDNFNIKFIDLENSYQYGTKPMVGIYSEISLKEWNQLDGKLADCHKLGNMFLYLMGRLQKNSPDNSSYKLKKLLLQKRVDSNVEELLDYLFSDSATVAQALSIMKNIYSKISNRREYKINISNLPNNNMELEIDKIISFNTNLTTKYDTILKKNGNVVEALEEETELGLTGVSGVLVYLKSLNYNQQIIEQGVDFVIKHLVDVNGLKGVQISENAVSPYFYDGISGVIQMLLYVNFEKYRKVISELSKTLMFEFAQFAGLWKGMLGIAITLLNLFNYTHDEKYLEKAEELLISSEILSCGNEKLQTEVLYVLSKYQSLKGNER